jgi:hypothetical protein
MVDDVGIWNISAYHHGMMGVYWLALGYVDGRDDWFFNPPIKLFVSNFRQPFEQSIALSRIKSADFRKRRVKFEELCRPEDFRRSEHLVFDLLELVRRSKVGYPRINIQSERWALSRSGRRTAVQVLEEMCRRLVEIVGPRRISENSPAHRPPGAWSQAQYPARSRILVPRVASRTVLRATGKSLADTLVGIGRSQSDLTQKLVVPQSD